MDKLSGKNEHFYLFFKRINKYSLKHRFFSVFTRTSALLRSLKPPQTSIKLKKITPHGLRHTHATILIDELIPSTDVANRLGNTLEMSYRIYAHSFEKKNGKTVSAFGNRLKMTVN